MTRGQRVGGLVAAVALPLAMAAEWAARAGGYGAGPRLLADADLEYRLAPGRWRGPAGQLVEVNAHSMRSGPIDPDGPAAGTLRVLVFGDSVVSGGAVVDQAELATTRLAARLEEALGRTVEVGNVAAPSWGPPNELAWARRYGFLGATVVVLVVSSHDALDAPTFEADPVLDPGYGPPPASAALEWVRTRLASWRNRERPAASEAERERARTLCLDAARSLLAWARATGAQPVLVLHRERAELGGPLPSDLQSFAGLGLAAGVSVADTGEVYERAVSQGQDPFRDRIHLSAQGQASLAEVLEAAVLGALRGSEVNR